MGDFILTYVAGLLMLLGGNRIDVLDALSTDAYWQVKHVTPELR